MIKAKNFAFDVPRITVPAMAQVTVEFENEDSASHDVAFSTDLSLTATIYQGKIIDGPGKITHVFFRSCNAGKSTSCFLKRFFGMIIDHSLIHPGNAEHGPFLPVAPRRKLTRNW